MNYAIFKDWIHARVDELVAFGVDRAEAEHLMMAVEFGAIADEAQNRSENQFLLDYARVGCAALAQRHGKSKQAVRKERQRILNRNHRLRAGLRPGA